MDNNKIYTILSLFTIASLCLVIFFIWPLFKDIENSSNDLISAKNSIATLDQQAVETQNFSKNYKNYKSNLEEIDQLFVDLNNPVDFIQFLEGAAFDAQVTSQISLPSSSDPSKNFIIFQLSSKGAFSDEADFLGKIESGPYLVEIENLDIQNLDETNSSNAVSASKALSQISGEDYSSRNVNATFTIKVFIKK